MQSAGYDTRLFRRGCGPKPTGTTGLPRAPAALTPTLSPFGNVTTRTDQGRQEKGETGALCSPRTARDARRSRRALPHLPCARVSRTGRAGSASRVRVQPAPADRVVRNASRAGRNAVSVSAGSGPAGGRWQCTQSRFPGTARVQTSDGSVSSSRPARSSIRPSAASLSGSAPSSGCRRAYCSPSRFPARCRT